MSRRRAGQRLRRPSIASPSSSRAPRWPLSRRGAVRVLKRCSSAPPGLFSRIVGVGDDESTVRSFDGGKALFRGHTCTNVLALRDSSSPYRGSLISTGYDAKVVVNVTVEGSPGPVRTMVRLGSSVEDAIVAVVDRYGQEGRMPRLDRDSVNGYELHHSYFSLQCLEKSERIGDVGSRSFYLRTRSNNSIIPPGSGETATIPPPLFMVSTFIAHKVGKIVRRARKLWKVVICSQ